MKTGIEIVDILWRFLNESGLPELISGKIYKFQRLVNSDLEDVVINCLNVDNSQLQETICNVNIHVPNKSVASGGSVDNYYPDLTRLRELTAAALEILKEDYSGDDYHFELQQHTNPIKDDVSNSYYINIRIEFYSLNISN